MARKGVKHKHEENTVMGITYVEGVNVGYDITAKNLLIPNVGFRSVRDVKRQLLEMGYKNSDIKQKRSVRKRENTTG